VILPNICDGLALFTRFSVALVLDGWLKFTCASLPTSKDCQLIEARFVFWLMVMKAPSWAMLACPAVTCPPVGSCAGAGAFCAQRGEGMTTAANSKAVRLNFKRVTGKGM